jgi:hypothetical protein
MRICTRCLSDKNVDADINEAYLDGWYWDNASYCRLPDVHRGYRSCDILLRCDFYLQVLFIQFPHFV